MGLSHPLIIVIGDGMPVIFPFHVGSNGNDLPWWRLRSSEKQVSQAMGVIMRGNIFPEATISMR